jgi:hypothetical protein
LAKVFQLEKSVLNIEAAHVVVAETFYGLHGGGVVESIISHVTLAHIHSSTHTSNNHLSLLRHHAY